MESNNTKRQKKYIHLSFSEREEISIGLNSGKRIIGIVQCITVTIHRNMMPVTNCSLV